MFLKKILKILMAYYVDVIAAVVDETFEVNFHVCDVIFGLLVEFEFSFDGEGVTVGEPVFDNRFSAVNSTHSKGKNRKCKNIVTFF